LRPESDAPDVFQSLKCFNLENPDGDQVLAVQAQHFVATTENMRVFNFQSAG
jgi:hypothetical protein